MGSKIHVEKPLVVLHGDEMAQVAFERILEQFVKQRLDLSLVEIDLSAESRLLSNGEVIRDSIEALKVHGVGIKNAGMTVNRAQLDELLAKHPQINEAELDKLATKSPNGAIRKGIGGNITREDIQFRNIKNTPPEWIGRDIDVDTMDGGGTKDSFNTLSNTTGVAKLVFVGKSGDPVEIHRRSLKKGDPWMLASNDLDKVKAWAHQFFQRALAEKRDAYVGLKDTVIPGYDGVMRTAQYFHESCIGASGTTIGLQVLEVLNGKVKPGVWYPEEAIVDKLSYLEAAAMDGKFEIIDPRPPAPKSKASKKAKVVRATTN